MNFALSMDGKRTIEVFGTNDGRGCDRRKDHELFLRKTTLVVCSDHFGGVFVIQR